MLQLLDPEFIIRYFILGLLLPLTGFLALLIAFWYFQSKLVLFIYYKTVLPALRVSPVLYWVVGGAAVASHEILGHALVGAATGSKAELHQKITPEKSQVKISHRYSAWGYLSSILSTLAPCFAPPMAALGAFAFLFPGMPFLYAYDFHASFSTILPNFMLLASMLFNSDLTLPANLFFAYLISVLSLTAGASMADFRIVFAQTVRFWHFALFLLAVFAAGIEVVRIALGLPDAAFLLYPVASFLLLSFLVVLLGLVFPLILALFLKRMHGFGIFRRLVCFLAFPAAYLLFISFAPPLPYFHFLALAVSIAFAFGFEFLLGLVPVRQVSANNSRMKRR